MLDALLGLRRQTYDEHSKSDDLDLRRLHGLQKQKIHVFDQRSIVRFISATVMRQGYQQDIKSNAIVTRRFSKSLPDVFR